FGKAEVVLRPLADALPGRRLVRSCRRVVAQLRALDESVRDVDPDAGDATLEPVTEDVVERRADVVVPPVEVGLLREEVVQVVLTARAVELPRAPAERGLPVVRRRTVRLRVAPDVPVAPRVVVEPRVLVRGVVRDEVEHDADAATTA